MRLVTIFRAQGAVLGVALAGILLSVALVTHGSIRANSWIAVHHRLTTIDSTVSAFSSRLETNARTAAQIVRRAGADGSRMPSLRPLDEWLAARDRLGRDPPRTAELQATEAALSGLLDAAIAGFAMLIDTLGVESVYQHSRGPSARWAFTGCSRAAPTPDSERLRLLCSATDGDGRRVTINTDAEGQQGGGLNWTMPGAVLQNHSQSAYGKAFLGAFPRLPSSGGHSPRGSAVDDLGTVTAPSITRALRRSPAEGRWTRSFPFALPGLGVVGMQSYCFPAAYAAPAGATGVVSPARPFPPQMAGAMVTTGCVDAMFADGVAGMLSQFTRSCNQLFLLDGESGAVLAHGRDAPCRGPPAGTELPVTGGMWLTERQQHTPVKSFTIAGDPYAAPNTPAAELNTAWRHAMDREAGGEGQAGASPTAGSLFWTMGGDIVGVRRIQGAGLNWVAVEFVPSSLFFGRSTAVLLAGCLGGAVCLVLVVLLNAAVGWAVMAPLEALDGRMARLCAMRSRRSAPSRGGAARCPPVVAKAAPHQQVGELAAAQKSGRPATRSPPPRLPPSAPQQRESRGRPRQPSPSGGRPAAHLARGDYDAPALRTPQTFRLSPRGDGPLSAATCGTDRRGPSPLSDRRGSPMANHRPSPRPDTIRVSSVSATSPPPPPGGAEEGDGRGAAWTSLMEVDALSASFRMLGGRCTAAPAPPAPTGRLRGLLPRLLGWLTGWVWGAGGEPLLAELRPLHRRFAKLENVVQSFTRYVPRGVVRGLLASGELCCLGMRHADCTIAFCDLAGFTALCERQPPQRISAVLTQFFGLANGLVVHHGGVVDKFIGDCVMAVWGAPTAVVQPGLRAILFALRLQAEGRHLRVADIDAGGESSDSGFASSRTSQAPSSARIGLATGPDALACRIGIDHGDVLVGNMGCPARMNFSCIGDVVNTASRLEGLNKRVGTSILVTQAVTSQCGAFLADIVLRYVGRVVVAGKLEPVTVSEPLDVLRNRQFDWSGSTPTLGHQSESAVSSAVMSDGPNSRRAPWLLPAAVGDRASRCSSPSEHSAVRVCTGEYKVNSSDGPVAEVCRLFAAAIRCTRVSAMTVQYVQLYSAAARSFSDGQTAVAADQMTALRNLYPQLVAEDAAAGAFNCAILAAETINRRDGLLVFSSK